MFKDCLGIIANQYCKSCCEEYMVWYQYHDGNAFCGPVLVLAERENTAWIHASGYMRKVTACKVMPLELIDRNEPINNKDHWVSDEDVFHTNRVWI